MDSNNWQPAQGGGETTMDTADWRSQLPPESRLRIVNKMLETLKRHFPLSGEEGQLELQKIAVRFEEKIYTAATSQSDYLRKISLKMLSMENNKTQNTRAALTSNGSNPPNTVASMDSNNWRHAQGGGEPTMDTADWRSQLPPESRQRILNKMLETLKRHFPLSGEEGLLELQKIAVRFEEKIYTAATSQSDYLRKISLKMLSMENNKTQNTRAALTSNGSNPPNTVASMDSNNWRHAQGGGEPTMGTADWRSQLPPESRQRILNKMLETLKRHFPLSGEVGLLELQKIAVRFEEKIYTAATSQSDYLRKISLKMLTMENNKTQNTRAALTSNGSNPPNTDLSL